MARLYVIGDNEKALIRINTKNGLKEDANLYEIDYLTLYYNKKFIDTAIERKCISKDMRYNSRLLIESDNSILEPIMYDKFLYTVAKSLYNSSSNLIDINLDVFKKDMDTLFRLLNNEFATQKLEDYFKNSDVTTFFNNYHNGFGSNDIIEYFRNYQNYRNLRKYYQKNIRYLCLVIDEKLEKYVVLEEDDKDLLDEYTMQFNSSYDIRDKYQDTIASYLNQNKDYLDSLSRKNNGYIVILAHDTYGMTRKKVLYKDTKKQVNSVLEDLKVVKMLANRDYQNQKKEGYHSIFSPYQSKIIYNKKPNIKSGYNKMMGEFKKNLFLNKKYDDIREILHFAKNDVKKEPPKVTFRASREKFISPKIIVPNNLVSDELDETVDEKEEFLYPEELLQMSGDDENDIFNAHYQVMKRV